jgi:hypothetical protein
MISYSCTVNGSSVDIEIGVVVTLDGTEQFDNGQIVIKHSTREAPYTEADDVILTVDGFPYELMIQADRVQEITSTLFNHTITLTEFSAKMVKYYIQDKFFTFNSSGDLWTHKEVANIIYDIVPFQKQQFASIVTGTLDALDTPMPQKKFEGLNLWQIYVDLFRGIKAVPRLNRLNQLSHTYYNALNNPITLSNLTGWQKDVDFNNYATTIVSDVRNATYDGNGDLVAGGTWWPSETQGSTPRSTGGNYSDDTAQYQLSFNSRAVIISRITNLLLTGSRTITADISEYVVSKEEWDGLPLGGNVLATLYTERAQRNTLYFDIDGNTVASNMADSFKDNTGVSHTTIEMVIKTWLFNDLTYSLTDYTANNIRTLEMQFFYIISDNVAMSAEKWDNSVTKQSQIYSGQKDTVIDIGRMGGVMNDIANRMSNGVWVIRQRHYAQDELLELNDYTSDGYKIIKAQHEFYPNHIDSTYELAKDWVTIDGYTITYRSTDPYSIGRDNVESNHRYIDYLEFSTTSRTKTGALTSQGERTVLNYLNYDLADDLPVYKAQYTSSDSNQGSDKINMDSNGMASTGAQGGMHFTTGFREPKNAGYRQTSESDGVTTIYKNEAVRYTAQDGSMERATIEFCHDITVSPTSYPLGAASANDLIELNNFYYALQPNEILGLNYELLPCTDEPDSIVVTSEFSKKNNLVRLVDVAPTLFLHVCLPTTKYTIYDTVVKDSQSIHSVPPLVNKSLGFIDTTSISGTATATWAISWQDTSTSPATNRLIMAVNYDGTSRQVIYINNLKERSTTEQL